MSSQRVRLITEVQTASVRQNTGEDSAESYLWSQIASRSWQSVPMSFAVTYRGCRDMLNPHEKHR